MNQQFVKLVTSKKMVSKSSDSEPVFMSDEFAYNRSNQGTKIMRDTQLENKRRTVLAHAEGGPYKVFERVQDKGEKSNRVYNVSENSIKEFVAPSLFSMSNRKEIKKCGSRNTKRNNNKKQSDNNKKSVNNKKNKGNNGNKTILGALDEVGYHIEEETGVFELSPHQLGIPQDRKRVIFVCIRKDIYDPDKIIDLDLDENVEINFDNIIEENVDEKYKVSEEIEILFDAWDEIISEMEVGQKLSPTILCNEFHSNYSEEEFKELPQWKQDYITKNKPIYEKYKDKWDAWYEVNKEILQKKQVNGKLEWQAGPKRENDSIWNHFIQVRQSGIRVKKSKFFPTLVAIVQTPIYGKEKRYITPRECARLQSFPDSFILPENDKVAYKQFGNAVNVEVVYRVMSKTLELYL